MLRKITNLVFLDGRLNAAIYRDTLSATEVVNLLIRYYIKTLVKQELLTLLGNPQFALLFILVSLKFSL
jgi:hypothetical protein